MFGAMSSSLRSSSPYYVIWISRRTVWFIHEDVFNFRIIAKGAAGGKGSEGKDFSKGATAFAIIHLNRTQPLYVIVGQDGTSACNKVWQLINQNSLFKKNIVINHRVIQGC